MSMCINNYIYILILIYSYLISHYKLFRCIDFNALKLVDSTSYCTTHEHVAELGPDGAPHQL